MSGVADGDHALIVGAIAAAVSKGLTEAQFQILGTELCVDDDGNYEPMFKVKMASGTYLVVVTPTEEA